MESLFIVADFYEKLNNINNILIYLDHGSGFDGYTDVDTGTVTSIPKESRETQFVTKMKKYHSARQEGNF
jgi:hypothetical protein